MRNLSKQNQRFYNRFQPATLRHCTSQKRLSECKSPLKESQIRVGKYKFSIEDVLGKGYSSKVYKGVEIGKQHKKYAIKAVDLKKFKGSNMQMLDAQIQIHQNIDHENIVKFHQVIKTPHHYYFILEYCPHGNLNDYINQKKKLSQNNAVQIMEQVMSAYKYLLQQGIMHRDLKPANILRVGNKWKICDFGFSVKSRFQFKDRINVGTPLYMPMQALTRNYYSYKTDLYALGIILYEMITGHTPWECRTQRQLLQKMREQQLVLPKDLKNSQVKHFILKCCEMNQNKRFAIEQFKTFQLRQTQCSSTNSSRKNNLLVSYLSASNLKSNIKSFRSSGATQESSTKSTQQMSKQNSQILMNQLNFCRHLYYMVVNIESFLIESATKQIFILVVYKHLLRLIKTLQNKKINNFNLKSWDTFKTSKTYHNLYLQFTQYSVRYEKQYLDYIKHIDIKSIRAVNRRFPELSHSAPLTQKFYTQLEIYLTQVIRQQNHELSQINTKQMNQLKDKIQALQSVYRYYKNLQAKKSQIQNCEVQGIIQIEKIKVIQNYCDSPVCYNDYLNLRKIIKSV